MYYRSGIERNVGGSARRANGAHSNRLIYGIIAAGDIPDNLRAEVLNKGLYPARIHDGEFELLTARGFKPEAFGPAAKHNGKLKKRPSTRK